MAAAKTVKKTDTGEALAALYAADLLHAALLKAGEPVKASDGAKLADHPAVDLKLARVILSTNPKRFASVDRKWGLWSRYSDPTRPFERNLEDVLSLSGAPAAMTSLAAEMASIYNRSAEHFERLLSRTLTDTVRFFPAGDDHFGLTKWLLDANGESEDDVLFDNYLKAFDFVGYEKLGAKINPAKPETFTAFLDAVGEPVPSKVLQFLIWRADPINFDATEQFTILLHEGHAIYLSNGTWIGPKLAEKLISTFPALAEKEVDEHGDNAPAEAALPLTISDDEKEQVVLAILNSSRPSHAIDLLESIFEVTSTDSTYAVDVAMLIDTLKLDERIAWIGADRFLAVGSIPAYVYSVPESLHIEEAHYTDVEGNEVDFVLEDDGYDGGLQRETLTLVAQDIMDEEAAYTPDADPPATARCVLKFHHKEIGTFPLCQLPAGFFPADAPILQVDLSLPAGQRAELWVNNETRLVYGLIDWYNTLPVDSGVVFYLERQAPDKFVLTYGEETEPAMFISRNRVNELMELGRRAEDEELPTFEIAREIMEHYRKGIEFITLLTEVNISRRSSRRLVASLLSGYHCFFQRGGAWVFDAKKLSQGFDKSKRKYLKKS
ncbi:MAG: hypothetical protein ABJA67_13130 [Chthonomonadales bacterium]